ncbi:hypothetical protein [Pseudodonghicola flavimaris]|uniref:Histidine kinase n=1 Tax=Pseudodonghicola flavimaris TaxID=3050036 RepID=A0ABT7EW22_9RHOB|nr:hypothetical protein [Pseudodonghicola flavimaris]MDK3016518.1 hypothetical protein [Pseudodonghicola flavimaris]
MPEDSARIAALEAQVAECRRAALEIILGLTDGIARTDEGRLELARGFEAAGKAATGELAALSRIVASALRVPR